MPQMSPLNWLMLLLFFSILYIFINIMNFFNFNYKLHNNNNKKMFKKSFINWKW